MLWLRYKLAATAPIRSLAWELPYVVGLALKKQKTTIKNLLTYQFNTEDGKKSHMIISIDKVKIFDKRSQA